MAVSIYAIPLVDGLVFLYLELLEASDILPSHPATSRVRLLSNLVLQQPQQPLPKLKWETFGLGSPSSSSSTISTSFLVEVALTTSGGDPSDFHHRKDSCAGPEDARELRAGLPVGGRCLSRVVLIWPPSE